MRLLEAKTLQFRSFEGDLTIPPYAILSHTWGMDEVTYKDMKHIETAEKKEGFRKIAFCATQAQKDGLDYIWVDTCCIAKSSSAELSEAINSMFRWYEHAQVCYTYLSDVSLMELDQSIFSEGDAGNLMRQSFMRSRWFTRGWTLQELIAPRHLIFFSKEWVTIGTKESLAKDIRETTGINELVLIEGILSNSVAQKMSWAARRSTSRSEDLAYCLMGLFEVNMPLLYGEGGQRAFIRLQEEIMKTSDDITLFCWTSPTATFSSYRGLLARSPEEFADCGNLVPSLSWGPVLKPYSMTNKGLMIDLALFHRSEFHEGYHEDEYCARLCALDENNYTMYGIYITSIGNGQYARVDSNMLWSQRVPTGGKRTSIFAPQKLSMPLVVAPTRVRGIFLKHFPYDLILTGATPAENWDEVSRLLAFTKSNMFDPPPEHAAFSFKRNYGDDSVITIDIELLKAEGRLRVFGGRYEQWISYGDGIGLNTTLMYGVLADHLVLYISIDWASNLWA